ncbi:hypothetical protein Fmac_005438 [Flemingia macrophylla]|uniref:Uncharacterized protein n=1 Tax=Flemingia macrophylla TaxID=520843 RepID=A0ABD1N855_9FABA
MWIEAKNPPYDGRHKKLHREKVRRWMTLHRGLTLIMDGIRKLVVHTHELQNDSSVPFVELFAKEDD